MTLNFNPFEMNHSCPLSFSDQQHQELISLQILLLYILFYIELYSILNLFRHETFCYAYSFEILTNLIHLHAYMLLISSVNVTGLKMKRMLQK